MWASAAGVETQTIERAEGLYEPAAVAWFDPQIVREGTVALASNVWRIRRLLHDFASGGEPPGVDTSFRSIARPNAPRFATPS